jgi:2-keto-3-deoxy-L-rhamnonate aldolase RhmA
MLHNKTKEKLLDGGIVIGTIVDLFLSPALVQILTNAGFDYVFIDTEHGNASRGEVFDFIQACRMRDITPILRVAGPVDYLISKALDMGAQGLIVPRVASPEVVKNVVQYSKFPPVGKRGFGTFAPNDFIPGDLSKDIPALNEELLTIIQIESVKAVDQVEEILSVEGVDVAFIGPLDLSIDMGIPGQTDHPELIKLAERVISVCKLKKMPVGIFGMQPEVLSGWQKKGIQFLTCNMVSNMLSQGAGDIVNKIK